MFFGVRAHQLPGRLAAGAYFLNAGVSKRHADNQTAQALKGMATTAVPAVEGLPADTFVKALSLTEIGVGTLLVTPFVPTAVAGTALTAFAAGLVRMYLKAPGMRQPGSLRPSQQGGTLVKDIWLLGMGIGFMMESFCGGRSRKDRRRK